jgi:hypothetical protein
MNKTLYQMAVAAMAASLMAVAGCEDQLGVEGGAATSVSFAATGGTSVLGDPVPPQNPVTISGHVIAVTSVELNLEELEVEGDSIKIEMRRGGLQVALPMNGAVVTTVNTPLLPGTYDEVEMDVRTVRIQGTFDEQPFDVTVRVDEELEIDIRPPLVVAETSPANVTVTLNVSNWFRAGDGSAIDMLNLTDSGRARLAENIEASFDAFDDHDRSGHH